MAWPSKKRILIGCFSLAWLGVQICFFIPPGLSQIDLPSPQGNFHISQNAREAVVLGAYSDRYQRFPKMELIPYLKKKGITNIRNLILTGHDASETGALKALQDNFRIIELNYPQDTALRMRKTFQLIASDMQLTRIKAVEVDPQCDLRTDRSPPD